MSIQIKWIIQQGLTTIQKILIFLKETTLSISLCNINEIDG
jgi:hypothetical protein